MAWIYRDFCIYILVNKFIKQWNFRSFLFFFLRAINFSNSWSIATSLQDNDSKHTLFLPLKHNLAFQDISLMA